MLHATYKEKGNWAAGFTDYTREGSNVFSRMGTIVYSDEDEDDELSFSFNITVIRGKGNEITVVTFVSDAVAAFPTWELPSKPVLNQMIDMGLYEEIQMSSARAKKLSDVELDEGIASFLIRTLENSERSDRVDNEDS